MTSQTPSSALIDLADAYGVATEYTDWQGEHTTVSPESIRAILAALDVRLPEGDDEAARAALAALDDRSWRRTVPPFTLVRQGGSTRVPVHVPHRSPVEAWIELEDGARIDARQLQIWVDPRTVDGAELGEAMRALADAVRAGQLPKLAVEKLDGEAVIGSGHEEALIEAGFSRGPRKLTATAR